MPKEILFLAAESSDGGYKAHTHGFAIYTQGDTLAELNRMAVDAVRFHFADEETPGLIRLHTVKEEVVAI